jgi:hypothetical protein
LRLVPSPAIVHLALAFAVTAKAAWAEAPRATSVTGVEPGRPSENTAEPDAAATLYYEAEAKYANGDTLGAFAAMQRSYALSKLPELLFNLGELARELTQCVTARLYYARYLEEAPHGQFRARARTHLEELSRECPDSASAPSPPPAPPPPRAYWNDARIAAWSMLGASVLAGAAGSYFALQASAAERDVEAAASALRRTSPSERRRWDDVATERYDAGEDAQTLAYACGAGALALAASGLALLWLGGSDESPRAAGASPKQPVVITVSRASIQSAWSVAF